MALKNKTRDHDKVSASRRAPRQTAQTANEYERPVSPAAALKRAAGEHPSALRPTDILALQRAVGNRAVGRLLRSQPDAPPARPSTPAGAVQRKTEVEEQALQGKFGTGERKENRSGLPDHLKAGIENLSGVSLDDVKVHYNSSKPAEVQALAFTQGTDIHVGPGEEKHLPHEAWHVVQQKQGRVKPTLQAKGVAINNEAALEHEADAMGAKADQAKATMQQMKAGFRSSLPVPSLIQMKWVKNKDGTFTEDNTYETYNESTKTYYGEEFKAEWQEKKLSEDQHKLLMERINADLKSSAEETSKAGQPKGYVKVEVSKKAAYVAGLELLAKKLETVAKAQLVEGAHDGGVSWHRSSNVRGATEKDYYLHPSKGDNTLYLLKVDGTHKDGIKKITIVQEGKVKDGVHIF